MSQLRFEKQWFRTGCHQRRSQALQLGSETTQPSGAGKLFLERICLPRVLPISLLFSLSSSSVPHPPNFLFLPFLSGSADCFSKESGAQHSLFQGAGYGVTGSWRAQEATLGVLPPVSATASPPGRTQHLPHCSVLKPSSCGVNCHQQGGRAAAHPPPAD